MILREALGRFGGVRLGEGRGKPGSILRRFGLFVAILLLPGALGATGNIDATLNADASNVRDPASALSALGTYQGTLAPDDVDWFRVNTTASGPQCVDLAFSGASAKVMLEHEANGVVRAVHTTTKDLSGKAAIAAPTGGSIYFGGAHLSSTSSATYSISTSARGLASRSTGDAMSGGDAGSSPVGALSVSPGCIGGFLSTNDLRDVYAVNIPSGHGLVYTFAAPGVAPLRAAILDAAGREIASITSGGLGTFQPPSGGIYYVAVQSEATNIVDEPYLLGLTVGPPDPGSSCRPYC